MSDPFIAEIRIFPFAFAPRGWAFCNGQLLPISQNTALFSLIGTYYGGDGRSTFGLPDLQGKAAVSVGQGPGLSNYDIGQNTGSDTITLSIAQMPAHNHGVKCYNDAGTSPGPGGNVLSSSGTDRSIVAYNAAATGTLTAAMNTQQLSNVGSGQPHNNRSPYLTLNYCIALQGIYPVRN